ncbi:Protein IN2-1-like B [Vitis vinifera]|uniref:Protein IN2-1-like B n=1 Tax=Vitis vinifera TaxID=29760 RepID=A0A438KNM7_VITVI|nr:Protein IN2-1-like B [Vitis vinifera]
MNTLTLKFPYNLHPNSLNYSTNISPKFPNKSSSFHPLFFNSKRSISPLASMAVTSAEEVLPPSLDSTSEPPPLFDGTTSRNEILRGKGMHLACGNRNGNRMGMEGNIILCRREESKSQLYTSYICPYAQRVWIARNYKGLQDKIKLVPIDLGNRPAWYKEKVYPENKVPSLEHNNKVTGESLDLIKYIDSHFEGPSLYPDDPNKRQFAEELLSYTYTFNRAVIFSLKGDSQNEINAAFDYLETALSKFNDGPFFLGQFSLVDIAFAPFIERFHPLLLDVKKCDITSGRPKLVSWIEGWGLVWSINCKDSLLLRSFQFLETLDEVGHVPVNMIFGGLVVSGDGRIQDLGTRAWRLSFLYRLAKNFLR